MEESKNEGGHGGGPRSHGSESGAAGQLTLPRFTAFNTPGLGWLMRCIGFLYLRIVGWRPSGAAPVDPKVLILAAPHTSNWDLPLLIAFGFHFRLDIHWIGKDSLFKGVRGPAMRFLGGIAINRQLAHGIVEQTIERFNCHGKLAIVIAPEGTRGNAGRWKTGFYNIAHGANVPVVCGFLDYAKKRGGFGPTLLLTGDREADIARLAEFYTLISGRYPEQMSPVRF